VKSYYDIVGVSPAATQEQIVAAYRLHSKILHPDRLDPVKQHAEWELANEMLQELNQAYVVLRDPVSRADYDLKQGISNKNLADAFHVFSEKILRMDVQLNRQHFRDEDDFRDIDGQKSSQRRQSLFWPKMAAALAGLIAIAATLFGFAANHKARKPPSVQLGTSYGSIDPNFVLERGGAVPLYAVPLQSVEPYDRSKDPANGFVFKTMLQNGHGTLRIQNGTSYHAVVKLVNIAYERSVFTVFVGAGEEFTIQNILDGTYKLASVLGRRWNWLNDSFDEPKGSSVSHDRMIFDTWYQRNGVTTYFPKFEVTLQPVVNGNAHAEFVAPQEFKRY
jgi:hypothetical protein